MTSPYIFISYSRKDADIASALHHKLEKYVYPQHWVTQENKPPHPRCIRPIFLDTEDLSAKAESFTDELKERMRLCRYLLVICTEHAAQSAYVQEGIAYFLETHGNRADLILPVFVDHADVRGLPERINDIKARRNCPVYTRKNDAAGKLKRQYCFYRIIEYVLKVDFEKLYNRHEAYRKHKQRVRMLITAFVAALICASLGFGWYHAHRQATIAEALATFESRTFPNSLVVGYVDNFLGPMMDELQKRQENAGSSTNHVIIAMPYTYEELKQNSRKRNSLNIFNEYGDYKELPDEVIPVTEGKRKQVVIGHLQFLGIPYNLYFDAANTVSAFEYVVDDKFSDENPLKPVKSKKNQDCMVRKYTDEFIRDTLLRLKKEQREYVHFVRTEEELRELIEKLRS